MVSDTATRANDVADVVGILDGRRVSIRCRAFTEVVSWDDIVVARSVGNCTVIETRSGSLQVHRPLRFVVKRLAGLGLMQIHRGVAVNSDKVRRLRGAGRHRLSVDLDGQLTFNVGRKFQCIVRYRFGGGRAIPPKPLSTP
jgi:DNA-binding LytR/AlgR family response regulator